MSRALTDRLIVLVIALLSLICAQLLVAFLIYGLPIPGDAPAGIGPPAPTRVHTAGGPPS